MKNRLSQNQRIFQKLSLTPKMKHSIQILGMSVTELNDYIEKMLAANPFLEKQRKKTPTKQQPSADLNIIDTRESEVNPRNALLSQIRTLGLAEKDIEIAEYLIYEMDENGYIRIGAESAARDLFTEPENIQKVLEAIQSLEPAGIGARDARECLQLQLKRAGKEDSLEYRIVTDCISDLAINDISQISRTLNADKKKVIEALRNIRSLNPKPASTMLSKAPESIVPDLEASLNKNKVRLELNREIIPNLRVYNPYENKLEAIKDPEVKEFLKKNMEAAGNLIDNIKRREETMCRVANYILNAQKDSLKSGRRLIKPLTIKDVAASLDLHPSTISRTISNKYIRVKDNTVPLGSFLSHSMKKENGQAISKSDIRERLAEIIKAEDRKKPITDSAITEKLRAEGINIKRRTVAKYRELLRILPRHLRKKKES